MIISQELICSLLYPNINHISYNIYIYLLYVYIYIKTYIYINIYIYKHIYIIHYDSLQFSPGGRGATKVSSKPPAPPRGTKP